MDALFATQWNAERSKILRHDWRTLRQFCTLLAQMCDFVVADADVRRADVFTGLLKCARLHRRAGNADLVDVMLDVLRGIIRESGLSASDQTELLAAVVAYSSTTSLQLCAECEALATGVCGFSGLLSFCLHGFCPCVTTPARDVVRPVLRELACKPALGLDPVGVAAGAVDVKEAPTTSDGRLSSAATGTVSAVSGYDPCVRPAGGVISVALASGIHEPQVGEQSIDVERDAGMGHLGAVECVGYVAFEQARDVDSEASVYRQGSVTSEEAVCEATDLVQEALPRIVASCDLAPCAAPASVFLAGLSAPALLRLRSATLQPESLRTEEGGDASSPAANAAVDVRALRLGTLAIILALRRWSRRRSGCFDIAASAAGDSVLTVLPGVREVLHQSLADVELCGARLSDGASDIAAGVERAVAVDRVSVLSQEAPAESSVELLAVSTCLVTEVLLMLLATVACGVAEARCGDARAVLDRKAVEFIDSGCDPPVTVVLSC